MPTYLVTIHRPDNYDPAISEDEVMAETISALNREMIAENVRVFVGGLHPIREAKSLHLQANGDVELRDGKYLDSQEYVGGLWVLDVNDMNEALEWGRKAAIACKASVEVRECY